MKASKVWDGWGTVSSSRAGHMACYAPMSAMLCHTDLQARCNLSPMARLRPGHALAPASVGETFEAGAGLTTARADLWGARGRARRLTWNRTAMRRMLDSIADSPCWRQRPLTRAARGWARRLTWNLMGMMNNPHYRVKVHAATWQDGMLAMRFEHPVLAGGEAGGCAAPSGPRRQVLQKLFPKEHGPCLSTSVRV